ncbi:MAG: cell division protein FtsA [Phocaeicola sp.]
MEATEFIVAIELGSSNITGIAGKKLSTGVVQILAVSSRESSSFIRKGRIYNLDKTANSLTSIIKELEDTLEATISKMYVGIGGQSLQSLFRTDVTSFEEETKVSQEFINRLIEQNRGALIANKEILEVIPQEYKLGINYLKDPVGVPCTRIEANFLNIVARDNLKQNIEKCFRQARLGIADFVISPLVLADIVLTPSEKRSGCALVDFGADTTTVSVYRNNILRYLAVIPLGSRNITYDLCSQMLEEDEAERLKLKYADAYTNSAASIENEPQNYIDGKRSISVQLFNEIVEGRINEILVNVLRQIEISKYRDKLLEGVVFTGQASAIKNLTLAFQQISKIDKVRVENKSQLHVSTVEKDDKDISTLALAILYAGKENCCKAEPKIVEPKAVEPKVIEPQIVEPKVVESKVEREEIEKPLVTIGFEPQEVTLFNTEEVPTTTVTSKKIKEEIPKKTINAPSENDDLKIKIHRCELLIKNAVIKKQNRQLEEALAEFKEALSLNIPEKAIIIEKHIEEINQSIKDRGIFEKLKKTFGRWSESMTEDL